MKKLFTYVVLGSLTFPFISSTSKADTNYFIYHKSSSAEIYKSSVSDSITSFEKIATFDDVSTGNVSLGRDSSFWFDESLNKLFFQEISGTQLVQEDIVSTI